jgi:cystathionine beta-lyase family protein involved in aluminum resistance
MNFNDLTKLKKNIEDKIEPIIKNINEVVEYNQQKVLNAFQINKVSDFHFAESTGYGHSDIGREVLENVYAKAFGAEASIVRPHIVSGTHAISSVLFGLLRPGDELLYITGRPYDTLEEVVGVKGDGQGSLKDFNISYNWLPLKNNMVDYQSLKESITCNTKMIGIQRSRGYANRPSFTVSDIKEMVHFCKQLNNNLIIFVDNCYGEFVETIEPTDVGVDIIAGSLIKNPGGGIVRSGGYIVGKEQYVNQVSYRVTSPGIGRHGGAMLGTTRELFQGVFIAPHVVGEVLKGMTFAAAILEVLGFETNPLWNDRRTDIIQAIHLKTPENLLAFCQAIQASSPVDSHVLPVASSMPGYSDPVVMAAGTFIQGASIELSADGPMREPYSVYFQGGLTYAHIKIAIMTAIKRMHLK